MPFAIVVIIVLSGCASESELQIMANNSTAIAAMQAQAAAVRKETVVVDCSRGGCGKAVISYTDPRDIQKVTGMKFTGTNDVIIQTLPSFMRAIGWLGAAWAATDIVDSIADIDTSNNTNTSNSIQGKNNSIRTGSSSDGNQRDTITSTDTQADTNSVVGDAISSDSNDTIDNSSLVNNYPIADSNNTNNNYPIADSNNTSNNYPIDDSYNDNSQQNETANPNYPPLELTVP